MMTKTNHNLINSTFCLFRISQLNIWQIYAQPKVFVHALRLFLPYNFTLISIQRRESFVLEQVKYYYK